MRQLDVKNTFLHGDLKETVYRQQPLGFLDSYFSDYVCKLHKSIYGLKQGSYNWYKKFSTFSVNNGFQNSP